MHVHCTSILTDVCANLKTLHTCVAGTPYEKFMKDHCKKTCEKCGEQKVWKMTPINVASLASKFSDIPNNGFK